MRASRTFGIPLALPGAFCILGSPAITALPQRGRRWRSGVRSGDGDDRRRHDVGTVNDAPTASGDEYATDEDTTLPTLIAPGVLGNDGDADGDPLTTALVAGPQHGRPELRVDGSLT